MTKMDIFVFGSNEAGRHGAGAARVHLQYGAVYGWGYGHYGNSYAIPTLSKNLKPIPWSGSGGTYMVYWGLC